MVTKKTSKIILPKSDKDLLDQCKVSAFRASGKGGQHVNVTDSAVRITHIPSGIAVTSRSEKSQYLNKKQCLIKLRKKIAKLNYKKPKRIPTKISSATKKKRKIKKIKFSEKKRLRQKIITGEDL